MKDVIEELQAVLRTVAPGKVPAGEAQTVSLRRTYPADITDVWDAITNPERIARWFLPITGDFRVGGRYQLEGNAGGEILRCEPPRLLLVTSMFGDAPPGSSEVEVRLSEVDEDRTMLVLEHTAIVAPELWGQYGPGAVGVGWDLTVLGLALHIDSGSGMSIEDKEAWGRSAEAREFMTGSADAWRAAHVASGASPDEAATAAANTVTFYVPAE
jgi:uncharacterized protein YndB with AHSA1/START domain